MDCPVCPHARHDGPCPSCACSARVVRPSDPWPFAPIPDPDAALEQELDEAVARERAALGYPRVPAPVPRRLDHRLADVLRDVSKKPLPPGRLVPVDEQPPGSTVVGVRLSREQLADLDARRGGLSRAEFMRRAALGGER